MQIAIVFLSLLITTGAAFVMKKRNLRRPMAWMVMAASSLVLWLVVLLIDPGKGATLNWQDWFFSSGMHIGLLSQIGKQNWELIAALMTLHVAFIFTSGAKQEFGRDYILWILEALEIALTFLILTAADLWSLILAWTAMDGFLFVYWSFFRKAAATEKIYRGFVIKFLGSILLVYITAQISGRGGSLLLSSLPAANSALVLLAALLHGGLFPLHVFEDQKINHQTVLDFLSMSLPFLSSMYLVCYLPNHQLTFVSGLLFSAAALAALIYFILMWVNSRDELWGSSWFLLAFGAFVSYSFFSKTQGTLQDWFVVLILFLPWLLLYGQRGKKTSFFPILLLIAMSGLPFSMLSYGSSGLTVNEISIPTLVTLFFHVSLLAGFIHFIFQKKADFDELESSSRMVYLIGIFITMLAIGSFIFRTMGSPSDEISGIWAGIFAVILVLGYYFRKRAGENRGHVEARLGKVDSGRIRAILSFEWLFNAMGVVLNWIKPLVTGFSMLLEGEGGVLWSIVFLALLVTLLKSG